ncbi:hypothetical protein JW979_05725 [bacterium]|nr:hypothetical protein [candidate division CSSED10-310 bacterium]
MKKLVQIWMIMLVFMSVSSVSAGDGVVPVITEAYIHPAHVTAGEPVHFAARVNQGQTDSGSLDVGVFFMHNNHWLLVARLNYLPEKDLYIGSLDIPQHAPNGTIELVFIARNVNGEHSEPVARELTIYSVREIILTAARGCLLSDVDGAVKNFHRGESEKELPVKDGLTVPLGTLLMFQSHYDGVWYDEGNGSMATSMHLWISDNNGDWHPLGQDICQGDILQGPALRKGITQVILPCNRPGTYLLKLAVASKVKLSSVADPITDHDQIVFSVTVEP